MSDLQPALASEACTLPSANSAADLVYWRPGAIPVVAFHLLSRSLLLGAGMYAAGMREHVVRYSIAGSVAIEAFVVGWMAVQRYRAGWRAPERAVEAARLTHGETVFVGVLSAVAVTAGVIVAWRNHRRSEIVPVG